jgi:hypothetical protein
LACVEFDEHASRVRFLVRGSARVMPWVLLRGSTSNAPGAAHGTIQLSTAVDCR